jgi:hypothetical protein
MEQRSVDGLWKREIEAKVQHRSRGEKLRSRKNMNSRKKGNNQIVQDRRGWTKENIIPIKTPEDEGRG